MSKCFLICDADDAVARALGAELLGAGHRVVMHTRAQAPAAAAVDGAVHLSAADLAARLGDWDSEHGPFAAIILNSRTRNEFVLAANGDYEALALAIEDDLASYLRELQTAARLMTRREKAQIWVLTRSDDMRYILPIEAAPITAKARIAAVRSLAKEITRFGVLLNAAVIQTPVEDLAKSFWLEARDKLKVYALKFKPVSAAAIAAMLRGFLENPQLPLSGMVIPIGIGFQENNI